MKGQPDRPSMTGGTYTARITRGCRWGPWAWRIAIQKGSLEFEGSWTAWTEPAAERKARRIMAKWATKDERRANPIILVHQPEKAGNES